MRQLSHRASLFIANTCKIKPLTPGEVAAERQTERVSKGNRVAAERQTERVSEGNRVATERQTERVAY